MSAPSWPLQCYPPAREGGTVPERNAAGFVHTNRPVRSCPSSLAPGPQASQSNTPDGSCSQADRVLLLPIPLERADGAAGGWGGADRERRAAFANSPAETWGLLEKLGGPAVVKQVWNPL